jgi:hypothetical protein
MLGLCLGLCFGFHHTKMFQLRYVCSTVDSMEQAKSDNNNRMNAIFSKLDVCNLKFDNINH